MLKALGSYQAPVSGSNNSLRTAFGSNGFQLSRQARRSQGKRWPRHLHGHVYSCFLTPDRTYWSQGLTGAKCALEVKDDLTFLDLIVRQIEHLNATHDANVPLVLMTSFNTHLDTVPIVNKYANEKVRIKQFSQSRYPRLMKGTLLPCPKSADDGDKKGWYPPGHGDLYTALFGSGMLDSLIQEGKEYLFVSNSDNLGAMSVCSFCGTSPLILTVKQCGSKDTPAHGRIRSRVPNGSNEQNEGGYKGSFVRLLSCCDLTLYTLTERHLGGV